MGINGIVQQLREAAPDYEKREVHLPIELVEVLNGKKQEKSWQKISAAKVMRYIVDMLEE